MRNFAISTLLLAPLILGAVINPAFGTGDAGNWIVNHDLSFDGGYGWSLQLDGGAVHRLTVDALTVTGGCNGCTDSIGDTAPISIADVASLNSLVPARINNIWWQTLCSPPVAAPASATSADGYSDAFDLNPLNSSFTFALQSSFQIPSGVTSVTVSAAMKKGANDTGTTSVGLAAFGCGSDVSHTSATLTSSWATYSKTVTSLSAGTYYFATLSGNNAGLGSSTISDPLLGAISVTPIGGTGFWANDFWRLDANPQTLWYNTRNKFSDHGPGAEMVVDTDATSMEVELYNTSSGTNAGLAAAVYVNGRLYTTIVPSAFGAPEFDAVSLPGGMKRVEIEAGAYTAVSGGVGPDGVRAGTVLQAIELPASATTYMVPAPKSTRTLIAYGDSLTEGYDAVSPLAGGWFQQVRRRFPGIAFLEAWAGRQFMNDIGGTSLTYVNQLVDLLQRPGPTDIWLMIGFNDWNFQTSTLANFQAAYATFLDALHAALPGTSIYAGMLGTALESTANGNGNTPPQYRSAIQTACTARAFCRYYDGTTLLPAVTGEFNSDNIHPAPGSIQFIANSVLSILTSTAATGAPQTFWPCTAIGVCLPLDVQGTLYADAGVFDSLSFDAGFGNSIKADAGEFLSLDAGSIASQTTVVASGVVEGNAAGTLPGFIGTIPAATALFGLWSGPPGSATLSNYLIFSDGTSATYINEFGVGGDIYFRAANSHSIQIHDFASTMKFLSHQTAGTFAADAGFFDGVLSVNGYIADTVQVGATNDYLMKLGGRMEIDGGATIAAVTLDGGLTLVGNCISDATHLCPPVTIDNANGGQLEALDVKSNGVPWWRIGSGGHDINLVTGGLVVNNFNACLQSTGAASGIAPGADKASTISVTTGTTVGVCAADTALFRVNLQNGYSSTGYIVLVQSRGTQSAFTTSAYHAIPASATAFDVYNDTAVTLAGATTYVLQFVTVGGTATY